MRRFLSFAAAGLGRLSIPGGGQDMQDVTEADPQRLLAF